MTMKHLQCRAHGGVFKMVRKSGRPPVKCGGTTKDGTQIPLCTRHPDGSGNLTDSEPAPVEPKPDTTKPQLSNRKRDLRSTVQKPADVTVTVNRSVPKAKQARELLETKGWTVAKGQAWREGDQFFAKLDAVRDEERLMMVWTDGELTTQDYSMWHNGVLPEMNGRPKSGLGFDPDELTDRELVQLLSGQTIEWWNRIGRSTERATVSGNNVRVMHTYIGGRADENPGERQITFVDHGGGGYRTFLVSALMKIGT